MRLLALASVLVLVLALPAGAVDAPARHAARVAPGLAAEVAALPADATTIALAVHAEGRGGDAEDRLAALGLPHSTLPLVGVSQVLVDAASLATLVRDPAFRAFYPEQRLELHMDQAGPMVRADVVRTNLSVTGEGVVVLVIDTGVDGTHPDLMDRVLEVHQPHDPLETGIIPAGDQVVPANDWFGHGTHVSGIVAGTGAGAADVDPSHGRYVGVAPGAQLAVWSIPGLGRGNHVYQALQGFEFALANQERLGLRVITNSWGTAAPFDPDHPINVASLAAYRAGMVVLFSAGNDGAPDGDVRTNLFGTAPWTLGIAAANKDGTLAGFSSRGNDPAETGDRWDHVELTAPGASIMSAKSRMGAMQALGPGYHDGPLQESDLAGQATHYQYASGTSMSTPVVAGVVALVLAANPLLAPDQVYDILLRTAAPMEGDYWQVGAGMVDAEAAVRAALATEGRMADFLAGERKYDDPADVEDDPLLALLDPPPAEPPAPVQDAPVAKSTPAPALALLVAVLAAIVLLRRR